ncbi:cell division protein FtsI (penicillin-binding protein 3) [Frankineae bacterium MT45]|nr:cell division protein FtsI (penicillin-binding protein 3) [Frankineae bacterium MT45]
MGFGAVCVLLLVIGARLVQVQGLDHGGYATAANAERTATIELHALRGEILDRNGTALAYTTDAQDITADPEQISAAERGVYAATLAPLLNVPAATIVQALAVKSQYALLAQGVDQATANKIEALSINDAPVHGIYTQATTERQYPGQTTAANVVGLVHSDGTGAAGIEAQYNSLLAGHDGSLTYSVDGKGQVNPSGPDDRRNAVNGANVQLTLDQDLQYTTQRYADSAKSASGARGVQVAILTKTGQVLALASNGTFNSADPSTITPTTPLDAPIQSVFEPGSVNKVVTFSAALEKGLITPSSVFEVPGSITTGGVTVNDAWGHPTQPFTATGILAESSNVGTLQIAQKLGPQAWDDYEQKFGIGQTTGIELPGESAGILPPMNTWSDSSFANLPIGQGIAMTVLQLASMYQTIANNGVRIPPRITQSVTQANGAVTVTPQPAGIRVVSPSTAKTVRTMLESVTLAGGTGKKAAIAGYRVAGKTGTAQQPDPANGGRYSTSLNWDTFAGMVPADNPQFVVAIMVDAPAHGLEGGDVAAPLFHEIATYEVQHAQVAPTGSTSTHVPLFACSDTIRIFYGNGVC